MFIGPAAPGDLLLKANRFGDAIVAYLSRDDLLGLSMVSLRIGDEQNAIGALSLYGFSRRSALSFMGHIFSQDGMHRGAAMLFYDCGRYGKAIRECLELSEEKMTANDRRRLALAYARDGQYGLASVQFQALGAKELARKTHEISMMQAFPPQKEYFYRTMIGIPHIY
jgi:hypothetical protein